MSFELTDAPEHHPGACMFTGSSRDLVDLKREVTMIDGRAYIAREVCDQLADAIGRPSQQAFDALEEQLAVAERALTDIEQQLNAANELLAEAESLRVAIAYTLEHGAVVDPKKLTVKLRHLPGQRRVILGQPLFANLPDEAAA